MSAADITNGRWPDLLMQLAGLTPDQLTDTHQPCPLCGGEDRYRFDDLDGTGSWYCNQCGGKDHTGGGGNGMDMLMRRTGLTYPEACKRIEQHLGHRPEPPTKGAEHIWQYGPDFIVCRFPGKRLRPLWWDGSQWLWKAPPAPRPLYNLDALQQRPNAPVLIVEGEKTADAAAKLFPSAIAITWPSGCKAYAKADWSPIKGRRCTLWPDADAVGRDAMAKLAIHLLKAGAAQVRIIQPPPDAPEGWDLADANWSIAEAAAYLKANRSPPTTPTPSPTLTPTPKALAPPVEAKPILDKPSKLETLELLTYLRTTTDNIRFNTFTRQIEINEKPLIGIERYYLTLAEQNVKVSKELAIDCLVQVANERQYDPVTEYLDNCAKVVKPTYIDRLATAYLRPQDAVTPEPTIYDEMLKRTLIGAVARAFDPGCKHDTACVLMGGQGSFKSTFWHKLGGLFFSDALGDIGSKDDVMVLHRSWIMEWAELDQITSRKHAGHIKSFLSRPVDMLRVPYGKAVEDFPRRGIIVGTTNKSAGFLVDETGNRRFWVIPTTKTDQDQIDTDSLEKERDSIWSAAVLAYRNGETSRLPAHLEQLVTNENDAYVVDSPWRDVVATYLTTRSSVEPLTSEELLTKAINKPVERQTRIDQMQIATILKDLGYIKQREPHGRRRWHYSRG